MKLAADAKPADVAGAIEGLLAAVEKMRRDFKFQTGGSEMPPACAPVVEAAAKLEAMIVRGPFVGR